MIVWNQRGPLPEAFRGGAVTIGNFDGVHRGHAQIVARARQLAARRGGPTVVFTFDPHPAQVLRRDAAPIPLTTTARKAELLESLGVDCLVAYPTDRAFLQYDAESFFRRVLCDDLAAKAIVEGRDFRFGRGREGDVATLARYCALAGMTFEVVEPLIEAGQVISSSRVRSLLAAGEVDEACGLLTQPYRLSGIVALGAQRGRTLGFPTANLSATATLVPGEGIYAGRAVVDGRTYAAAISLGPNVTFDENERKIEVYLIDFSGDLYGRPLSVDFMSRLRDIMRFDSTEALIRQMKADVEAARAVASHRAVGATRSADRPL